MVKVNVTLFESKGVSLMRCADGTYLVNGQPFASYQEATAAYWKDNNKTK